MSCEHVQSNWGMFQSQRIEKYNSYNQVCNRNLKINPINSRSIEAKNDRASEATTHPHQQVETTYV